MADIKEASTNLYVVSNKYGVVESKLTSGFSKDSEAIEKKYKIENIPSEVLDICKELESIGGRALLVGGSVRDCVISKELPDMKLKPKDFDLEVYGMTAEVLQRVLVAKFGEDKVDSVGRAFGILKVKIEGWDEPLDFSIPRTDSKTGEGHKGFVVTGRPDMTLRDAAARRDITANSMAYDPLTEIIYDPYGGIKDIKDRLIRVTDEKTFQEDPLRVIRVMQFAARFEFNVEPKTEALCKTMVERGDVDYKKSRNGKEGDGHFIEGDEEKEGEHKGFLVISEGRQVYMKPKETEEEKGLAKERVTEEIYKLLLKGRSPSLGFEFARRIELIQRLWPDMAAMDGVPQEYDWHKEGDVWKHSMQNVDVMVEIANRELADGKIPTPDMWQKMEDQLKMFGNEIKKQFLFDLYKKEILSVLGQQGLSDLYNETNRLTDEYKKAHLDRLEGIAYETASNRAKNIFEKQISHWDEVSEFVVKEEMSDEERKRRIDDITKTVLGEILTKEKPKWLVEANALGKGFEIKEIRRILDEKIQGLVSEGKISQERLFHIEEIAEEMTHKRTEEERLKRVTGLKNDIKIVLLMTALCHDLGKVTTTKFEDGRIRSKGHEQAGVEPMRRILSTFDTTRFSPQMRSMILPLIAEHLKPGEIYRDIMGIKNEEDEREEEQGAEDVDSKQLKRRLNRLSYRLVNGDADKSLKGGRKQVIYGDGGGANLYLLGLVAEADQRGRDSSGKPTRREDMGKKLDWQAWWNKNIEELNLNQSEEKIFSGDDLLKELGMSNKQGGPWVGVVMSCVNKDILDELIKKDKVDALQAAADYYQRLNIWVNGQYDLLPQEKKNERERISIWTSLLKRDPREVISL